MGALSATHTENYREPFAPLLPGFDFVRFNDPRDLERRFSDDVAAVVFETVQGDGGVRTVSEEFYRRARELTREAGAALIADEVQCGLGRTGRWFAVHKFAPPEGPRDELPDMISIAKPLGGGIPMGAVLLKEEVAETIRAGTHGTTFGGGPLACRVSLETLKVIEDEGLLEHVRETGAHFKERLGSLLDLPAVVEVRGEGLMLALELKHPSTSGGGKPDRSRVHRQLHARDRPPIPAAPGDSKQTDRHVRAGAAGGVGAMTEMWKVLGTKVGFRGWRITVRTDRILNPDGRETTRDIVEHPGAVTIVALPAPDKVILIRQYRHATGKELLELPAGTREEGEDPIDTAKRELEEETGYRAGTDPTACGLLYRPGFSPTS